MSSKSDLRLDWATHKAAKYAVENWHYSQCMPKSKLAKIGVWEEGEFIGVIIYGVGATSSLVQKYGIRKEEGCELVRIALRRHQNTVSRIVAVSLKMLRRKFGGLRLVVSFADPEQGHHGGIYQAGGWVYNGDSSCSMEYIYKGKRWQGRSFRNSFKGMENHADVTKIMGTAKHRYLMPLDKAMRAQILPLSKPYPKRARSETSDTAGLQLAEGGAAPTLALQ